MTSFCYGCRKQIEDGKKRCRKCHYRHNMRQRRYYYRHHQKMLDKKHSEQKRAKEEFRCAECFNLLSKESDNAAGTSIARVCAFCKEKAFIRNT